MWHELFRLFEKVDENNCFTVSGDDNMFAANIKLQRNQTIQKYLNIKM